MKGMIPNQADKPKICEVMESCPILDCASRSADEPVPNSLTLMSIKMLHDQKCPKT